MTNASKEISVKMFTDANWNNKVASFIVVEDNDPVAPSVTDSDNSKNGKMKANQGKNSD